MAKKIQVIGASVLDVTVRDYEAKAARAIGHVSVHTGGDACNQAHVLAAFGIPVALQTLLGNDRAGAWLQTDCQKHNIELSAAYDTYCTPVNLVFVDKAGERTFLTDPDSALRKLDLHHIQIPQNSIVSIASMFVSECLGPEKMAELARQLKAKNNFVAMDFTSAKHGERAEDLRDVFAYVDLAFMNEAEGSKITGELDPDNILRALHKAGAKQVILKRGAKAVHILKDGKLLRRPVVPNPGCVDTTGCGDSFAAGFLAGLYSSLPFEDCLKLACACGSAASGCVGATEAFENKHTVLALQDHFLKKRS
jgi:sugar/nucleoside kinase (ribokinase family)